MDVFGAFFWYCFNLQLFCLPFLGQKTAQFFQENLIRVFKIFRKDLDKQNGEKLTKLPTATGICASQWQVLNQLLVYFFMCSHAYTHRGLQV